MTLCDRLAIRAPIGNGRRLFFRINGVDVESRAGVIDAVLERYSNINGPVRVERAQILRERLAKKYCWGSGIGVSACLRRWDQDAGLHAYPDKLARTERRQMLNALLECLNEGRHFVDKTDYASERLKHVQEGIEQEKKRWEEYRRCLRDDENLKDCRRFIKQIKKVFNENSKDDRAIA